ncbi:Uncharacterized conserved protein [Phaffia rhodozyma]|uniref:Uncharacterized conserved protein n=1 Tax=Phaffia rhodozyma TaxID=264483 RepID=A0A0F7SGY8_PHARH|nr:Uncharacterized conserved protein [Phaffia rhodozyma]
MEPGSYSSDDLVVESTKLSSDQAHLYILQFLSTAEEALAHLSIDEIKPQQSNLETTLLQILTSTSPAPGRPIRNLAARCLVLLHRVSENRSLFDFMRELLKVASGESTGKIKGEANKEVRVACWYVVGEVMRELGENNMSFISDICLHSIKLLRASSHPVILRYNAILTLKKSFIKAGKAVSDQAARDILKQLRNGLSDKALSIQRVCADTLLTILQSTPFLSNLSEIEPLLNQAIKSLDTSDSPTRRSIALLIAHLLAYTQKEGSAPPTVPSNKKKSSTGNNDNDEEDSRPAPSSTSEANKTLFTLNEMFKVLSVPFNKVGSSRKLRNTLIEVYATLFATLGSDYVEAHYPEISRHLLIDLISHSRNSTNTSRQEILLLRKSVGVLLRVQIGVRLLSEQSQIQAIRELTTNYLKKYPSMPPNQSVPPPPAGVLVPVLTEVAGLLDQLGNAPLPVQEVLLDPLFRLIIHPSTAVRVSAAWCLRCFCHSTPLKLAGVMGTLVSELTKEISMSITPVAPSDISIRMIGHSTAISALVAIIPERPLYVSYDVSATIMDLAISLLKRAGEHDVALASVEIQVAWTLIGSLMTLGPSFVKLHLPQLLVLWRNALPKPTSKDSSVGSRSPSEWKFLLDVREATLASMLSFLRHNYVQLVNLDVARRLIALLSNTLTFINSFSSLHSEALRDQPIPTLSTTPPTSLSLLERESNLRRRIFQCFTVVAQSPAAESLRTTLVSATLEVFAEPERYAGSAAQAAIAASAGSFAGVWAAVDGYAFGVTSLVRGDEFPGDGEGEENSNTGRRVRRATEDNGLHRDQVEVEISSSLHTPILGSLEYDALELCFSSSSDASNLVSIEQPLPSPAPALTSVVDAAIELFALVFPSEDADLQAKTISQMVVQVKSTKLEKNPGRKMAVFVNSVEALRRSLRNVVKSGRPARDAMGSLKVAGVMKELLQDAILDSDSTLRSIGSEGIGRLSSLSATSFLNAQIQWLVDQIVNNRNPESRAGCALSFGTIYTHVGSLIGGPLLKTMVNILNSLANDPHPVVHFWALTALAKVVTASSLSYSPFISSTLGQLVNIYLTDLHEPEGGTLNSVNIRGDLPAYQAVCKIISAILGVLGPELQEAGTVRSLAFIMVNEFSLELDEGISVEAIKCQQQFLMFAPKQVDVPKLVASFRLHLASTRRPLKIASIDALYQLVQRDAPLMSKIGGNQLVEDLFGLLDDDPSIEGVRDVILNWTKQTSAAAPSGWIDLCQRIMNRTTASQQVALADPSNAHKLQDEEVQSIVTSEAGKAAGIRLTSRWRTQLFALQCLHEVVLAVVASGRAEHFNLSMAKQMGINPKLMLVTRVGDLIKTAFSASTAQVIEIRLQGLTVLKDVIQYFRASPDPDFEGALLLEQHQAPIAAALTPAFSSDSTPEVLASAIQLCAVFVGSGVVKEVERMGRILKLLTSALSSFQDANMTSLGEVKDLSINAAIMLKISTMTAWANLQSSSVKQTYLRNVVGPHRAMLVHFWVTALRDFARLRTDPEAGPGSSIGSSADPMTTGVGREVLLPYYEASWAPILQAIATVMDSDDDDAPLVRAMDGLDPSETSTGSIIVSPSDGDRTEPTTNFFVLYGLAFEALANQGGEAASYATSDREIPVPLIALEALRNLVGRRFSGSILSQGPIFEELCTLFYRLAMTAPPVAQARLVMVLASFVKDYASILNLNASSTVEQETSQLSRCLAIVTYVLRQAVPSLNGNPPYWSSTTALDRIDLIKTSLTAYMNIVDVFPIGQREELLCVAIYLYSDLLKDETSKADLAGPTISMVKTLCDRAYSVRQAGSQLYPRVLHGLLSACILHIDEMRGRSGPVAVAKVRNNLLALVLLMTGLPSDLKVGRALVERTCEIIGQKLSAEEDEISMAAIQCTKTLFVTSSRGSPVVQHCVGQLIPHLVTYVARSLEVMDEPEAGTRFGGLEEVVKTFISFVSALGEESQKTRGYVVLLPTLVLLMNPKKPNRMHNTVVQQLLQLAGQSPTSFREATCTLDPEARSILESSIRQSVEASSRAKEDSESGGADKRKAAPAIALRSFG